MEPHRSAFLKIWKPFQVQQKNTVDTLREKVPDLLPEQGIVSYSCASLLRSMKFEERCLWKVLHLDSY